MPVAYAWKLSIDVDAVLRGQGADPQRLRQRRSPAVAVAEQALAVGLPLLAPAVLDRRLPVRGVRHERLLLDDRRSLNGPLVVQHLCTAEEIAVVICTVGAQIDALASACFPADPALGVALDALGSAAVDALSAAACARLDIQAASEGLRTTMPIGPGLLGWPLASGQRELFALVDAGEIGMSLTDRVMMLPHKSSSMVIGIGTAVQHEGDVCAYCTLRDTCSFRGEHRRRHG